jgi:hypothetical protein
MVFCFIFARSNYVSENNEINMIIWSVFGLCFAKISISLGLFAISKRNRYIEKHRKEEFRVSFSYLIRIVRSNEKFFLVKSSRNDKYQPVGGVFKFSEASEQYWQNLGFTNDGTGELFDFRGTINGNKLKKFIKKFKNEKNRETCPYREFKEEVLKPLNYLDQDEFMYENLSFKYIKTEYIYGEEVFYPQKNKMNMYLVYSLVLTEKQDELLKSAVSNERFKEFTKSQIRSLGMNICDNNHKPIINEHTKFILNTNMEDSQYEI